MTSLGYDTNHCTLEVTVLHSLLNFGTFADRFRNVASIEKYFKASSSVNFSTKDPDLLMQVKFTNEQLHCELSVVDSTDDSADTFTFRVWNIPTGTILSKGDYLLFKFYWDSAPDVYTTYHGIIKTLKSSRAYDRALLTVVKGNITDQDILSNTSSSDKHPKLDYYSDVKDWVESDLSFNFTTTAPGFIDKIKLTTPILTKGKSVSVVLSDVCQQLTKYIGENCSWKFINSNTILVYKTSDLGSKLLNNQYKIRMPTIDYNDVHDFSDNGKNFTIVCDGIPTLTAGVVFRVEVTSVPSFISAVTTDYVVESVEHNITTTTGFIDKIYCTYANSNTTTSASVANTFSNLISSNGGSSG